MAIRRKLAVGKINSYYYQTPHKTDDLDPEAAVLKALNSAKESIFFAVYSFTLDSLGDAIIAAHNRGVFVQGVADLTQSGYRGSEIIRLAAAGVPVRAWGNANKLMHDKVFVVDGQTKNAKVGLGSFNWSARAESTNLEVLLVSTGVQVSRGLAPALQAQIRTAYNEGLDLVNPLSS